VEACPPRPFLTGTAVALQSCVDVAWRGIELRRDAFLRPVCLAVGAYGRAIGVRTRMLGRNLVKHWLFRDLSIRSEAFGREHMADLAVRFIRDNGIPGSYLEFGVWRGAMFAQFYHTLRRYRMQRSLVAFDSFQGLPEARGIDAGPNVQRFAPGTFRCSQADFVHELARWGVAPGRYLMIPGFFRDSLTPDLYQLPQLARAALVWIDSLYYESATALLEFVEPILEDGAVLMFNSYYRFAGRPDLGEQRAISEFLLGHPMVSMTPYAEFGGAGRAFIAHR